MTFGGSQDSEERQKRAEVFYKHQRLMKDATSHPVGSGKTKYRSEDTKERWKHSSVT